MPDLERGEHPDSADYLQDPKRRLLLRGIAAAAGAGIVGTGIFDGATISHEMGEKKKE